MGAASHAATGGTPRAPGLEGAAPVARIGPNAIRQTVAALADRHGQAFAAALLHVATGRTPDTLPTAMVEEGEVQALVRTVHDACGEAAGAAVLADAGARTGDYLLAHRIPRPAQWAIRHAPRRVGLRLLLGAMARHAWTFAGSGTFSFAVARTTTLAVHACPMCRGLAVHEPACTFYAATFERLVRALVDDRLRVRETACAALGADACRFVVAPAGG